MNGFPRWVPAEVTNLYWELYDHGDPRDALIVESDIDALRKCIESPSMEKAWRALEKRESVSPPAKFAHHIVTTSWLSRTPDRWSSKEQINRCESLLKKVHSLVDDFDELESVSTDRTLKRWFGEMPQPYLQDLAARLNYSIGVFRILQRGHKMWVGKPGSPNSKRTYVIRLLSLFTRRNYDQPLHDVVAATAGVVLDEDIDSELVRKISKPTRDFPPYLVFEDPEDDD